jgi:hypothetical protein
MMPSLLHLAVPPCQTKLLLTNRTVTQLLNW